VTFRVTNCKYTFSSTRSVFVLVTKMVFERLPIHREVLEIRKTNSLLYVTQADS